METIINAAAVATDVIKDGSTATFMADVIEASRETPVIVDFWAPWCGPCKQLGPALEKVVTDAAGAVRLVKINVDENQELAGQLRVQSIPAVFAFKNGQPVDGFAGALPESQIRQFVGRLTGGAGVESPLQEALDTAKQMAESGDHEGAAGVYSEVLQHDPKHAEAMAGLGHMLIALGHVEQARELLEDAPAEIADSGEIKGLRAALELLDQTAESGDVAEARAAVEAAPADPAAHYALAMASFGDGDRETAVTAMLESIALNRAWDDEAARKQLLKFFEAIGHTDPLTMDARRRLSAILFS
jgi:putative thioredoxin